VDNPGAEEINSVGTIATIAQHLRLPNGNVKLLVHGNTRARVLEIDEDPEGFLRVVLKELDRPVESTPELQEHVARVGQLFERYMKYSPGLPYETMLSTVKIQDAGRLADTIAAHLPVAIEEITKLANPGFGIDSESTEKDKIHESKDHDKWAADEVILQNKDRRANQNTSSQHRERDFLDHLERIGARHEEARDAVVQDPVAHVLELAQLGQVRTRVLEALEQCDGVGELFRGALDRLRLLA
jgi:ATP-dependent Lon protease